MQEMRKVKIWEKAIENRTAVELHIKVEETTF